MKEITNVSVDILKVHPKNAEFFDDIKGDEYERFKKSIKEDGILSPIIVSPDMTIISGHQRVKACRELGIKLVPVIIREDLVDEDEKLKKLLVANFGRSKNDPIKQGKVYQEYEKLCGIRQGSAGKVSLERNNFVPTQEDIAKQLGVDVRTIQNLKRLQTLSPELQELISDGKITATTGYKVLVKLSEEEQKQLVESLDITKKVTQSEVQKYIDEMQRLKNVNAGYEMKLQKVHELENQIGNLKQELDNRPTVEKTVEVKPDDYDSIKKSLNGYQKDYNNLESDYNKKVKELSELKQQLESMKSVTAEEQYAKKLKDSTIFFCARVDDFIEKSGGFTWLSDHVNELPKAEKQAYIKAVDLIENWATAIKQNMKQYLN